MQTLKAQIIDWMTINKFAFGFFVCIVIVIWIKSKTFGFIPNINLFILYNIYIFVVVCCTNVCHRGINLLLLNYVLFASIFFPSCKLFILTKFYSYFFFVRFCFYIFIAGKINHSAIDSNTNNNTIK